MCYGQRISIRSNWNMVLLLQSGTKAYNIDVQLNIAMANVAGTMNSTPSLKVETRYGHKSYKTKDIPAVEADTDFRSVERPHPSNLL